MRSLWLSAVKTSLSRRMATISAIKTMARRRGIGVSAVSVRLVLRTSCVICSSLRVRHVYTFNTRLIALLLVFHWRVAGRGTLMMKWKRIRRQQGSMV